MYLDIELYYELLTRCLVAGLQTATIGKGRLRKRTCCYNYIATYVDMALHKPRAARVQTALSCQTTSRRTYIVLAGSMREFFYIFIKFHGP